MVVITLNEAHNLPRCLRSVRNLADEIIVMDSGSTDATRAIARAYGAHVWKSEFLGYGRQKQLALEKARREWILCLDADEWLDREARRTLSGFLASARPESSLTGFCMRRELSYLGRRMRFGGTREWKLRVVRRGCGRWEDSLVHESLRLTRGVSRRIGGTLRHRPFRDLSEHLATLQHYTDLIAQRDRLAAPVRVWFGMTLEPVLVFIHKYLLQLGCLDGSRGFLMAAMTAFYFFLRYAKIWRSK